MVEPAFPRKGHRFHPWLGTKTPRAAGQLSPRATTGTDTVKNKQVIIFKKREGPLTGMNWQLWGPSGMASVPNSLGAAESRLSLSLASLALGDSCT